MNLKLRDYVIRRLAVSVLVFLGVVMITFIVSRVIPSNPAALYAGNHPTQQDIENARRLLHLDQPMYVQLYYYLRALFSGDFGDSLLTHSPVLANIMAVLPNTLTLITLSTIVALIVGIPIGVLSAINQSGIFDRVSRVFAGLAVSFPSFWLGLLFQIFFFGTLHILPLESYLDPSFQYGGTIQTITGSYLIDTLITGNFPAFFNLLPHLVLPALTLAAYPIGVVIRQVRSSMVGVLGENYIRTARAYGISAFRIHFLYALKNAIIPTLVIIGLVFAYSLTGAFFVEEIFDLSGLGQYSALAVLASDYPSIVGVTIIGTLFYIGINLATDVAQAVLDPRVVLD